MTSSKKSKGPSPSKAAKILHDGKVHGKALTNKQRKFMGAKANQVSVKRRY